MTSDLEVLKVWLKKYEVTTIAMESTGVYWKSIFNIMEDEFDVILANPQHIKALRMNKTDIKDCKRIANLLRHGLVPRSFIPPRAIRELRDLNRTRRKLVGIMASEKNRVVKVLEDAKYQAQLCCNKDYGISSLSIIHALLGKDKCYQETKFVRWQKANSKRKLICWRKLLMEGFQVITDSS